MKTWRHEGIETWKHGNEDMKTWRHGHGHIKQKTEALAIFLNLFTVCSSWKFVICPLVGEETNGSHPLANGLKTDQTD
jgi:hypothetical protein